MTRDEINAHINKAKDKYGNPSDTFGKVTIYNGIEFRSRMESEWYKFLIKKFPDNDIIYEPGSFVRENENKVWNWSYTPDFVIMPRRWRRPKSRESLLRAYRRVGIFCEVKPEIYALKNNRFTDQDKVNQLDLVESSVLMLYGYPDNGQILLVQTWGNSWPSKWHVQKLGLDLNRACHLAHLDLAEWKSDEDFGYLKRSEFVEKISSLRT